MSSNRAAREQQGYNGLKSFTGLTNMIYDAFNTQRISLIMIFLMLVDMAQRAWFIIHPMSNRAAHA